MGGPPGNTLPRIDPGGARSKRGGKSVGWREIYPSEEADFKSRLAWMPRHPTYALHSGQRTDGRPARQHAPRQSRVGWGRGGRAYRSVERLPMCSCAECGNETSNALPHDFNTSASQQETPSVLPCLRSRNWFVCHWETGIGSL